MTSRKFWAAAGERAGKTFAQTLVAMLTVGAFGLLDAPWIPSLSAAGMAGLLSVLTSIASYGSGGGPSMTNAEVLPGYVPRHQKPEGER